MLQLLTRSVALPEAELIAWRAGDRSLLKGCSVPLRKVLCRKAGVRPGRRFFGEAYIASREPHDEGWYGSFKWLTSAKWCGGGNLSDPYQRNFREALRRHFPALVDLQGRSRAYNAKNGGQKPVGPDLWLTTPEKHRFIEVKLPGDRLARHQLVGLALIATLESDRPISVEVVTLHTGNVGPLPDPLVQDFGSIYEQIAGENRH